MASGHVISINVGGTVFTTTTATLTQDTKSMLATMFNTEVPQARDSNGNIFIDRNPKTFEIILEFLRSGNLIYNEESALTLRQLEVEADYFGLGKLLEAIEQKRVNPMTDQGNSSWY